MIQVFSKDWFAIHQKKLLWFLNTPIVRLWFRYVLRINGKRSSAKGQKIEAIVPNAIAWREGGNCKAEFRTHDKFAKRLYYAFKPFWYMFHAWDLLTKFKPEWNLGFDTLTVYPDANTETTSVDGYIRLVQADSNPWTNTVNAADGDSADDSSADLVVSAENVSSNDRIFRIITLFDTSALTTSANISDAVYSLHGDSSIISAAAWTWRVVSSNPASNTSLAVGDYDSLGSTAFASDYASGSYNATNYNDMTLNDAGKAAISLNGITKFGVREVDHDIGDSDPGDNNRYLAQFRSADQAGTADDPKLVITYTLGGGAGKNMLLLGVG